MLELEVQEKAAHDNVWKKRGSLVKRMHHVLREVETDVAAIVEADDHGTDSSASAYAVSLDTTSDEGKAAWSKQ
jgi:hypothetical protein